ncbi:MAG: hypothetical protein ACK442_08930, partial [Novosphingobium sp.]
FTEDVLKRYEAYGWHTIHVQDGNTDLAGIAKAIEEAKAGASVLTADAKARAEDYRDQLSAKSGDLAQDARELANQAKDRAAELAVEGKAKASDAIATLGKIVGDNATTIDEKLGTRYGDYARTASRTMQESAAKLDSKDINELGEDAKQFVRKSPGMAVGIAAAIGFLFARLFKGSSKS